LLSNRQELGNVGRVPKIGATNGMHSRVGINNNRVIQKLPALDEAWLDLKGMLLQHWSDSHGCQTTDRLLVVFLFRVMGRVSRGVRFTFIETGSVVLVSWVENSESILETSGRPSARQKRDKQFIDCRRSKCTSISIRRIRDTVTAWGRTLRSAQVLFNTGLSRGNGEIAFPFHTLAILS